MKRYNQFTLILAILASIAYFTYTQTYKPLQQKIRSASEISQKYYSSVGSIDDTVMQFNTSISNLSSSQDINDVAIAEDAANNNLISICEHYRQSPKVTIELRGALTDYTQRIDRCVEQLAYVQDEEGLVNFVQDVLAQKRALAANMLLNGPDSDSVIIMISDIMKKATDESYVGYRRMLNDILVSIDPKYETKAKSYEQILAIERDIHNSLTYKLEAWKFKRRVAHK